MNPFKVNNIIKNSKKNDERITIDALSQRCNGRIRHKFVKMSDEMFECNECGGLPRHWVKRLNLHSWITMWFYNPEKYAQTQVSGQNGSSLEEAQSINPDDDDSYNNNDK